MRIHKIKSYRTIFLFETFILFILILNNCNSSILNTYKLPIFLLIILIINKYKSFILIFTILYGDSFE